MIFFSPSLTRQFDKENHIKAHIVNGVYILKLGKIHADSLRNIMVATTKPLSVERQRVCDQMTNSHYTLK